MTIALPCAAVPRRCPPTCPPAHPPVPSGPRIAAAALSVLGLLLGTVTAAAAQSPAAAAVTAAAQSPAAAAVTAAAQSPAAAAVTAAAQWQVDYGNSRLGFSALQGGEPFAGQFGRFTADVRFDAEQLAGSRVAVSIDMTSTTTGNLPRDATLREPDWFDVARYPEARFVATSFRNTGTDLFEADGELTIRDVTRAVVLPFRLTAANGSTRAEGALTINRTDFGVGRGGWARDDMVGFPVIIRVLLVATPAH